MGICVHVFVLRWLQEAIPAFPYGMGGSCNQNVIQGAAFVLRVISNVFKVCAGKERHDIHFAVELLL